MERIESITKFLFSYLPNCDITYVGDSEADFTKHVITNTCVKFAVIAGNRNKYVDKLSSFTLIRSLEYIPKDIYDRKQAVVIFIDKKNKLNAEKIIKSNRRANIIITDFIQKDIKGFQIGELKGTGSSYVIPIPQKTSVRISEETILQPYNDIKFIADIEIPEQFYNTNLTIEIHPIKNYEENLIKHLRDNILPLCVSKPEQISKMLTPDTHATWMMAFTEEIFDPNNSYENIETLGDYLMAASMAAYLSSTHPNLTKQRITELKKNILSYQIQSLFTIKLGFDKFIRSAIPFTRSMFEDVIEAFFYALYHVGQEKFNQGFNLCVNLFSELMNFLEIDYTYECKDAPTEVQQIFITYGWVSPSDPFKSDQKNPDGSVTVKYFFNAKAIDYLMKTTGMQIRPFLSSATANTKKEANMLSARLAQKELESYGINAQSAQIAKQERIHTNPIYKELYGRLEEIYIPKGFVNISFIEKTTKQEKIAIIMGEKADGTKEKLHVFFDVTRELKSVDLYIAAMKDLLSSV